jgi:hypothetical protein
VILARDVFGTKLRGDGIGESLMVGEVLAWEGRPGRSSREEALVPEVIVLGLVRRYALCARTVSASASVEKMVNHLLCQLTGSGGGGFNLDVAKLDHARLRTGCYLSRFSLAGLDIHLGRRTWLSESPVRTSRRMQIPCTHTSSIKMFWLVACVKMSKRSGLVLCVPDTWWRKLMVPRKRGFFETYISDERMCSDSHPRILTRISMYCLPANTPSGWPKLETRMCETNSSASERSCSRGSSSSSSSQCGGRDWRRMARSTGAAAATRAVASGSCELVAAVSAADGTLRLPSCGAEEAVAGASRLGPSPTCPLNPTIFAGICAARPPSCELAEAAEAATCTAVSLCCQLGSTANVGDSGPQSSSAAVDGVAGARALLTYRTANPD